MEQYSKSGFTLLELAVALGILALIVAIAVPSYQQYTYQTHRHYAMDDLLKLQLLEERYRNSNSSYASLSQLTTYNGGSLPIDTSSDYYTYTITGSTATTYILTATAVNNQVNDSVNGTSCTPLTINAQGVESPSVCWGD